MLIDDLLMSIFLVNFSMFIIIHLINYLLHFFLTFDLLLAAIIS